MLLSSRNKVQNLVFGKRPFTVGSLDLSTSQNIGKIMRDLQDKNEKNVELIVPENTVLQASQSQIEEKNKELPDKELPVEICTDGSCLLPRKSKSLEPENPPVIPTKKTKFHNPPKTTLFKPFLAAINDFKMIKNNDKILIGLSGGKDSLTLLHLLKQYQFMAKNDKINPINFDIAAVTVDPMADSYDPRPLIPYLKKLNVKYFYEQQNIVEQAKKVKPSSICAFCSRLKRGRLYQTMKREGYNVLALGQHLDDLAESFLMGAFHNGALQTMKVNYKLNFSDDSDEQNDEIDGNFRVIRPLCYIREINTRNFAEKYDLPIIPENCPACFDDPKERHRLKQLLATQELLFPRLFDNIKRAIVPLMERNKNSDPIVMA